MNARIPTRPDARRRIAQEIERVSEMAGAVPMEFKDYYADARRGQDRLRQGNEAGVPEAGAQAPSRTSTRATSLPRRASRKSTRRTRCSAIPTSGEKYDELGANWRQYEQAQQQGQGSGGSPFGGARWRRRLEHQHGRAGRLPHDDRRRDARDVRERGSVLGLLPDLLRRRRRARGRPRGRRRATPRTQNGRDIEHEVELTLEEAYHGATRRIVDQAGRPRAQRRRSHPRRRQGRLARARRGRRRIGRQRRAVRRSVPARPRCGRTRFRAPRATTCTRRSRCR